MKHIRTRTVVRDDKRASQFVAYVDGKTAGHSRYELHGDRLWVFSTQMDRRFAELGVEDLLIEGMLQEVLRRRLALLPFCLRTRPTYLHILATLLWCRRLNETSFRMSSTAHPRRRLSAANAPGLFQRRSVAAHFG